ncbi:hypothetical protein TRFO_12521 [Tritrichomonas foetus]|uniref:Uncharacterized protein n=1 Tax=Tritrichomonas foetus TaxID=1144522 RepID=A0A1J4L1Q3_9EUKA|nr:hypothetical protein TRFO_12521 [Tritrichomonas foetus]|eukprot:OHT17346.1 hypothetical protein TRFO_12521 [Tritrichomonas foetus]
MNASRKSHSKILSLGFSIKVNLLVVMVKLWRLILMISEILFFLCLKEPFYRYRLPKFMTINDKNEPHLYFSFFHIKDQSLKNKLLSIKRDLKDGNQIESSIQCLQQLALNKSADASFFLLIIYYFELYSQNLDINLTNYYLNITKSLNNEHTNKLLHIFDNFSYSKNANHGFDVLQIKYSLKDIINQVYFKPKKESSGNSKNSQKDRKDFSIEEEDNKNYYNEADEDEDDDDEKEQNQEDLEIDEGKVKELFTSYNRYLKANNFYYGVNSKRSCIKAYHTIAKNINLYINNSNSLNFIDNQKATKTCRKISKNFKRNHSNAMNLLRNINLSNLICKHKHLDFIILNAVEYDCELAHDLLQKMERENLFFDKMFQLAYSSLAMKDYKYAFRLYTLLSQWGFDGVLDQMNLLINIIEKDDQNSLKEETFKKSAQLNNNEQNNKESNKMKNNQNDENYVSTIIHENGNEFVDNEFISHLIEESQRKNERRIELMKNRSINAIYEALVNIDDLETSLSFVEYAKTLHPVGRLYSTSLRIVILIHNLIFHFPKTLVYIYQFYAKPLVMIFGFITLAILFKVRVHFLYDTSTYRHIGPYPSIPEKFKRFPLG